ncbi:MAG: hypothetical protein IGBAC_2121 [Ignavibacteriae bacterium]|nr:MAG: hypothetical protein IGBAC_2121 [Ignavibacteriota bacterium]
MICSACNTENLPQRLYCSSCGNKLASIRHICGFINNETDNYCGGCGKKLKDSEENFESGKYDVNISKPSSEFLTEVDIKNILEECSMRYTPKGASLTQEEIEKLFKS